MKRENKKYRLKKGVVETLINPDDAPPSSADDLTHDEYFGSKSSARPLDESDSGEGTNEGLGDGNIGRSGPDREE